MSQYIPDLTERFPEGFGGVDMTPAYFGEPVDWSQAYKEDDGIDIVEFLAKFNKEYNFLYDNYDRVAGYREAVDAFEEFLSKHNEFVTEFCLFRGDFITSDREAAAFMFAIEEYL